MSSKKKILFITPPYHAGVVESAGTWMPLVFVYLAGAVRKAGYEAKIYDAMSKQHSLEEIGTTLRREAFDYIAITSITASINASIDVLALAKRIHPGVKTIMGGVHPTFCYQDLFGEHSNIIDYIVVGEGEETLPELLKALDLGNDVKDVAGLTYVDEGEVKHTAVRPFCQDLDSLPTAWDLIDWEDYRYFVIPDSRLAAISTSRGCTHGCTFCSQQKFWGKTWRGRDPQNILAEMQHLHSEYGVNIFLFVDEYPTKDRERWERLLDLIIVSELDVYILLETRAEDIVRDEDILEKYKAAGVIHIYIGLEATSQETLDLINKELSIEASRKAIRLIHAHHMITETSFVIGFPWETKESIDETLRLAQEYSPDFAHFLAITPWPYAEMYREMEPFIEVYDYGRYNLVEPIIKPETMSLKEVRSQLVDCYRRYYMNKAHDFFTEPDAFKKEYLKTSMRLIMKNSFLTELIRSSGQESAFSRMFDAMTGKHPKTKTGVIHPHTLTQLNILSE
ncbi:MAG: cobalamin-dependent protein [Candidatus Marinimicrobia bacterium]|nr:cobalamin-dependent protein [Candidatus Neomarinimicrobiota bacterium]